MILYRSKTLEIKIEKPDSRRAFVFDVEVGVSKSDPAVDPMSGMLLNLVDLDAAMADLQKFWQTQAWGSLQDLLESSRDFLSALFAKHGCFLHELCLREKRGFWVAWTQSSQRVMGREEVSELGGRLFRLRWQKAFKESEVDFLSLAIDSSDLTQGWEHLFESRTELQSLEVEDLGHGKKWSIAR